MERSTISLTLTIALATLAMGTARSLQAAPLTWEQCLKEAAQKNPDLLKAESSLQQAKYGKSGTIGRFLPQVNAGASQNRSGNQASPFSGGTAQDRTSVNLSVSENLFNGFKDKSALDQAGSQVDQAVALLDSTRAQVSRDLKSAFYNLLYCQQQVPMLQGIADRQKENVRMVELRFNSGRENKGSLLQSQASALQAAYEVFKAKRALRISQRQLVRTLGRSELEELAVQGEFTFHTPAETPDFKKLALQLPSTRVAAAQLRTAKSKVTSAKGEFLPTLNASGSMSRGGRDWMPEDPSWSAGMNLSLSLFSGGQDLYNLKSAKASLEQAEVSLTAAEQDAAIKLEDAFYSFADAVQGNVVRAKSLEASKVQEEIASAQYANGLLTYQNWTQYENGLISDQKSELQGRLAAKQAEADWELAQGKGELP